MPLLAWVNVLRTEVDPSSIAKYCETLSDLLTRLSKLDLVFRSIKEENCRKRLFSLCAMFISEYNGSMDVDRICELLLEVKNSVDASSSSSSLIVNVGRVC
jgi:hypothetical protein